MAPHALLQGLRSQASSQDHITPGPIEAQSQIQGSAEWRVATKYTYAYAYACACAYAYAYTYTYTNTYTYTYVYIYIYIYCVCMIPDTGD